MPKLTDKIGSGMTERRVVEYDWDVPGDVDAQIQAAITTFQRSSFAKLFEHLTQHAAAILDKADLPSDPEKLYLFSREEGWAAIEEDMDLGPEWAEAHLTLGKVMEFCKVPPDSPEGYAVRVIMLLRTAQEQLQAGSTDDAMASAFAAGALVNEAGMKEMFEPDFLTGEKVREGGQKGQAGKHGTAADRAAKRRRYTRAFDIAMEKGVGRMEAYLRAAEVCRVSEVTIRRAVAARTTYG